MKITLLEPVGIPAQVVEQYKARLEAKGPSFTAYGDKTTDPAELIRRRGDSDIAIIANNRLLRRGIGRGGRAKRYRLPAM